MGTYNFMAQYQQDPIPLEGNLFKRAWFRYYTPTSKPRKFDRVVQSWDTALKIGEANDYSVCTSWGVLGGDYYLLDVLRERLEYPDLKRRAIALASSFKPNAILVEDTSAGASLVQDLRRETRLRPIALSVAHGDKEARAVQQSAKVEAGQVFLPEEAPWLDTFCSEMVAFPGGAHDDQVDSVTQFLRWITGRPGPRLERPNPERPSGLPARARPSGPRPSS
jgi:predicted phage terminase large subunit-like protein